MGVTGQIAPGFERVARAFEQNFDEGLEHGAAFAVFLGDECVVALAGGWRDKRKTLPWETETISAMYSTTKAMMALVVAMLVDRGKLAYDEPVAAWWPEFAVEGKGDFTLAQVLSHQCGIPGFVEPIDTALWFDPIGLAEAIARMKPMFWPGEGTGYHPLIPGYVAAELARRVDGRTIGGILRDEVCGPLDLDYRIGTPVSEFERIAEQLKPLDPPQFGERNAVLQAAFLNPWSAPDRDGEAWKTREIPSANGIGSAKATARIMSAYALKGRIGERRLISEDTWRQLVRERVVGMDHVQPGRIGFAAGLQRNTQASLFGPGPHTVGHTGWGGSAAWADPDAGFSAAYLMNRKGTHLFADHRRARLIDAVYCCL